MRTKYLLTSALLSISLTACGILPASGPYSKDVEGSQINFFDQPAQQPDFKYATLPISPVLVDRLSQREQKSAAVREWPAMGSASDVGVSVGDELVVTIYESQSGGLFVPVEAGVRPGNYVGIPSQTVDQSGTITIPYAGKIKVLGRRPSDIADEITEKLGDRAIEPQVVVSTNQRVGAEVSVIGEVNSATKFSMRLNGEKILDAIARAGGPRFPGYETYVSLQRKGREFTIPFDELVLNPKYNINLTGKDTIYLYREAETFQVYGAAGLTGNYNFGKKDLKLSEAISLADGLNDNLADPEEIYLYRQENRADMDAIGLNYASALTTEKQTTVPVIYRLNLRKADGFFLAQNFPVKKNDIVYIANAESVEFNKFLNLLNPTSVTKINTHNAVEQ